MKRISRRLSVLLVFVLCLSLFSACGKSDDKEKYTLTFYNGETVLGTVDVEEGATLDKADYEAYENLDGYVLKGWYGSASFLDESALDLTTATFSKDTNVYGDYRSTNVTEDTKSYYIVGESKKKGALSDSSWAGSTVEDSVKENYLLTRTTEGLNEFTITIDLYKEDMFQIVADWAWDTQLGYGYIASPDDSIVSTGEGGLNADTKKSNIQIGQDGNYTITLVTDPDNDAANEITIVRNGDATVALDDVVEEETTTAEVVTTLTGDDPNVRTKGSWKDDWSDIKKLDKVDGTNNWTITMDLDAATELCFSGYDGDTDTGLIMKEPNVKDDASKALITSTDGNNIKITDAGNYTFTVNGDTLDVTITKN